MERKQGQSHPNGNVFGSADGVSQTGNNPQPHETEGQYGTEANRTRERKGTDVEGATKEATCARCGQHFEQEILCKNCR